MKRATLFQIAHEGWYVLTPLIVLVCVVAAVWNLWAALPFVLLLVPAILLFRDRPRRVLAGPMAMVAPLDGMVMHRREGYDPFLDREAVRISICINRMGAYYVRSPAEGELLELAGDAETPRGQVSWLRTDEDDDIVLAFKGGMMLGARPCAGSYRSRIGQGRCCGVRRLAGRIDVYLPQQARVMVEPHDRVRAGHSVLAEMARRKS